MPAKTAILAAQDGDGLLIVNADDWGRDRQTTDAIDRCWRSARISSASAMVWMADSERAAQVALETGLPTGLHLNLVEPFTGKDVPRDVRTRQAQLARIYRNGFSRPRLWLYDPTLRARVDASIRAQIERFRELYRRDPTHVDGHRHFHLTPNVLLSRALEPGTRVRSSFTYLPLERSLASRAVRRARNALIASRFVSTTWFFDLRELHPGLGGDGMAAKLGLARSASVEVMTHPAEPDEYRLMMADEWRRLMDEHRPRSFGALGGGDRARR